MTHYSFIPRQTFARACDLAFDCAATAADKAAALGVSVATYNQYRNGRIRCPVEMVAPLLAAMHALREERDAMETYLESVNFPIEEMAPGFERQDV